MNYTMPGSTSAPVYSQKKMAQSYYMTTTGLIFAPNSNGELQAQNKPMKLSSMFKYLVDSDTQDLKKAGFINGDLELTTEGKTELWTILFAANKEALVAAAKQKLEEEKNK